MSEIRKSPVTGSHVIIAAERAKRPYDFKINEKRKKRDFCPFCPGNEKETPPEVTAVRNNGSAVDSEGWEVRVVPNKFAAVKNDIEFELCREGMFSYYTGKGAAEVVIESPEHNRGFGSQNPEHILKIINILEERYNFLKKDKDNEYIQIFKNYGSTAGASLEHAHWQIITTPLLPAVVEREIEGINKYYKENDNCVFCQMIDDEKNDGSRIIKINNSFTAFAPYASRNPFEVWIVPEDHKSCFGTLNNDVKSDLVEILKDIVSVFENNFNYPYNLILHTAPKSINQNDFHWHIEILPRLSIAAGFELGTGMFINPTPPEIAAESIRERI
ncbi:MAG: galactose-1-phosphate uridylyltransferase [Halothermotrichaceae bacterium]